jgi:hypothetical protein
MRKNDDEVVLLHDLPTRPGFDSAGPSTLIETWAGEYFGQYFKK